MPTPELTVPIDLFPAPLSLAWVSGGEAEASLSAQPGAPWGGLRDDKVAPFFTMGRSAEGPLSRRKKQPRERGRSGRRTKFNAAAQGKLLAMIAVGVSQREAAASLGFCHTTVSKALRRDADFAKRLRRALLAAHQSQRWRQTHRALGAADFRNPRRPSASGDDSAGA